MLSGKTLILPFKLVETALEKLKNKETWLEPEKGLLLSSNQSLSLESQIMSALVYDVRTYYTKLQASELEFYRNALNFA